jgi:GH25 family lysozyme M1 (1,4-beta-N-acetylmuramidase)
MSYVLGTDLSRYQKRDLDWPAIWAKGVRFVYLKATEGAGYVNPNFDPHFAGALSVEAHRGPYHYFQPGIDPWAQAQHFFDVAGNRGPCLPPVIDFETFGPLSKEAAIVHTREFMMVTEDLWKRPCMVYTYPWLWSLMPVQVHGVGSVVDLFGSRDLWIAHYPLPGKTLIKPTVPFPWTKAGKTWRFWQFDGNKGMYLPHGVDADFNYFNGSEQELEALVC